jgi:hypothetical protein
MALFEEVFNRTSIYEMFFFNIKSVLSYPSLEELEKNDKPMYDRWCFISKTKHNSPIVFNEITDTFTADVAAIDAQRLNDVYLENAVRYHEFCKIVAISYATVSVENGMVKRELKKFANTDETLVIKTLMDMFYQMSSDAAKSTPIVFRQLCGHNIIAHDIPLLIKRHIRYNSALVVSKEKAERETLPLILKRALTIKPWESGVLDTLNVWKFNGFDNTSLTLISDFLGLKKSVDLMTPSELSRYYWDNIDDDPKTVLDYVSLQSATQTNLVIQLMNEIRHY